MNVSWDSINKNMDQIIEEFERLYVEKKTSLSAKRY